jgi:hypothetical protein
MNTNENANIIIEKVNEKLENDFKEMLIKQKSIFNPKRYS